MGLQQKRLPMTETRNTFDETHRERRTRYGRRMSEETETAAERSPAKKDSPIRGPLARFRGRVMVERWVDRYSGSEMTPRCDPARAVHLQNSPRWRPAKASSDGTNQGFGIPSFPTRRSMAANIISRAGTGTGEPPGALREEETIHQNGTRLDGYGAFLRAGQCPGWTRNPKPRGSRRSAGHARDSREQENTRN
jgi:hypothetical protein